MNKTATETKSYKRYSLFPKTLSECIEPITRPALKSQGLAGTKIINEWENIVGKKLALHCVPQKLSFSAGKKTDGTLSIAVENGFATEIQHLQPLILEKLATYFGYKAVSRIAILHNYYNSDSNEANRQAVKGNKKLRSQSYDFTQCVKNIDDEELHKVLTEVAKTLSQNT